MTTMPYKVAAFYQFASLPDFRELREPLRKLCGDLAVKGSVLLAHEGINGTLAGSPEARDLLAELRRLADRCCPAIPDGEDFVHYDFTPANLLCDGNAITGVIDINPLTLAGDRAFDLATMLFYYYDRDEIRGPLRGRLLDLAGSRAAAAYLAHMVLRQVDWSLRYHPAAIATQRHLRLARAIIADIKPQ